MRLELLPVERWSELRADFKEFGEDGLPSGKSEIYVLLEDEEIIGWFMLERGVTHAGPFRVREEYRGKGIGMLLAQHAIRLTAGEDVYVAALNEQSASICERMGLTRVEGSLWLKAK